MGWWAKRYAPCDFSKSMNEARGYLELDVGALMHFIILDLIWFPSSNASHIPIYPSMSIIKNDFLDVEIDDSPFRARLHCVSAKGKSFICGQDFTWGVCRLQRKRLDFFINNPNFGRPSLRFSKIIATWLATPEPQIGNSGQLSSILPNFGNVSP